MERTAATIMQSAIRVGFRVNRALLSGHAPRAHAAARSAPHRVPTVPMQNPLTAMPSLPLPAYVLTRALSTTTPTRTTVIGDMSTRVNEMLPIQPVDPATIDWNNLGFNLVATKSIVSMVCDGDGHWGDVQTDPYGMESVHPGTDLYARRLFEGMKAGEDEAGNLFIIRPDLHYDRLVASAKKLGAPAPTFAQFSAALIEAVKSNAAYVPPHGKGSLYLRIDLGVCSPSLGNFPNPGEKWRMRVITTPVGQYYKPTNAAHSSLFAVNTQRVVDTGAALNHWGITTPGAGKLLANYGPGIPTSQAAKAEGCADVLYMANHPTNPDDKTPYVGETSSSNVLTLFTDENGQSHVIRPKANGNLNSVTARGIIELAAEMGAKIHEVPLPFGAITGDKSALSALAGQLKVGTLQLGAIHLTGTAAGGKTSVNTVKTAGQEPVSFEYKEGNVLAKACTQYEEIRNGGPNSHPKKEHWFLRVPMVTRSD